MESGDAITYSHSREDMLAHLQRHVPRPKAPGRTASLWSMVVGVCLIGLSWPDKVFAGLIAAVFVVGVPIYLEFRFFPRHARTAYEQSLGENSALLAPRRLRFDATGIEVSYPDSTIQTAWTAFEGYEEDEKNFYLKLRGSRLPGMIPKRAFAPDQLARFSRLLKERIQQPPTLKTSR